jgi:hypothetical protein
MALQLVELEGQSDIQLLRMLFDKYHRQGVPPGGGAARRSRYFVWVTPDGFWVAGAWLHDNTPFRFIAEKLRIGSENSYFIRRICKFAPGDWLVDFLVALCDKLREEGKEYIWTLGMDDHSNALYRKAGFTEYGKTVRSKIPVYARKLHNKN